MGKKENNGIICGLCRDFMGQYFGYNGEPLVKGLVCKRCSIKVDKARKEAND